MTRRAANIAVGRLGRLAREGGFSLDEVRRVLERAGDRTGVNR